VTTVTATEPMAPASKRATQVDIIVPVHNEVHVLADNVERLKRYLADRFPFSWRVTVVDNASTDATWEIAQRLSPSIPGVHAVHIDRKGRGLALRTAWEQSDAEVVAYMAVDLSTDLDALLPLVAPLVREGTATVRILTAAPCREEVVDARLDQGVDHAPQTPQRQITLGVCDGESGITITGPDAGTGPTRAPSTPPSPSTRMSTTSTAMARGGGGGG
jgi:hypothetical protein